MNSTKIARDYLEAFETTEMVNLGVNIHILETLVKNEGVAFSIPLTQFIEENISLLKAFNFKEKGVQSIETFLECIDLKKQITKQPKLKTVDWNPVLVELTNKTAYQNKGKVNAFFYHTGLLTGKEQIKKNYSNLPTLQKHLKLYHLDENPGSFWPAVQIADKPLYAFVGPSAKVAGIFDNRFSVDGFAYELINKDIRHVIAIGHAEDTKKTGKKFDFINYFSTYKNFSLTRDNQEISISFEPTSKLPKDGFGEYKVNYEMEIKDLKTNKTTSKKGSFTIFNIETDDCQPILLPEYSSEYIHKILLEAKKKNEAIAVHCQMGLGRTGAWLIESALLEKFTEIFSDSDVNQISAKIKALVDAYRQYNDGFVLVKEQLYYAISNARIFCENNPEKPQLKTLASKLKESIQGASPSTPKEVKTLPNVPSPFPDKFFQQKAVKPTTKTVNDIAEIDILGALTNFSNRRFTQ